jgi:hypothetical protein
VPTLLMSLRDVPPDEADEVRALLEEHGIEYYETAPHWWGISAGGIWLPDDTQLAQARLLLVQYQRERVSRSRAEYRARRRSRDAPRIDFVKLLLALAVIGVVLYFSIRPFIDLGQ